VPLPASRAVSFFLAISSLIFLSATRFSSCASSSASSCLIIDSRISKLASGDIRSIDCFGKSFCIFAIETSTSASVTIVSCTTECTLPSSIIFAATITTGSVPAISDSANTCVLGLAHFGCVTIFASSADCSLTLASYSFANFLLLK